MEFKVGDKVRIKKDLDSNKMYRVLIVSEMEEYKGKVAEIVAVRGKTGYALDIDKGYWRWSDDTFELVESKKFTKSDLKDGDVVTRRDKSKSRVYKKENKIIRLDNNNMFIPLSNYTEDLKNTDGAGKCLDIIKVERPVKYETVFERVEEEKKEILDKVEKNYLARVIKPFRDKVECIIKQKDAIKKGRNFLTISIKNDIPISVPDFDKNTMYKGMEVDKKYTLEDLGI